MTPLDEARKQAEEALRVWDAPSFSPVAPFDPIGSAERLTCAVAGTTRALRALLAATADPAERLATAEAEHDALSRLANLQACYEDMAKGYLEAKAELDSLRLALETATRERDEARAEVDHWKPKAKAYGEIVHACSPALEAAGHPIDSSYASGGAVVSIKAGVEALVAERDASLARLAEADEREEKLHETTERIALSCVDAEDDRDDLAEMYRTTAERLDAAYAVIDSDNAVCLCGCPASEHEMVDEGAEQCEHEDHVCLRTCPAIRDIHQSMLADLARRPAPPAPSAKEAPFLCRHCGGNGDYFAGTAGSPDRCHYCGGNASPAPKASPLAAPCGCVCETGRTLVWCADHAPAPEAPTDPWRACGCASPDDCEHVFYDPAPEPSTDALLKCEVK